jgi:hypothetical protein
LLAGSRSRPNLLRSTRARGKARRGDPKLCQLLVRKDFFEPSEGHGGAPTGVLAEQREERRLGGAVETPLGKAIEPRVIEVRRRDAEPVFELLRHEASSGRGFSPFRSQGSARVREFAILIGGVPAEPDFAASAACFTLSAARPMESAVLPTCFSPAMILSARMRAAGALISIFIGHPSMDVLAIERRGRDHNRVVSRRARD